MESRRALRGQRLPDPHRAVRPPPGHPPRAPGPRLLRLPARLHHRPRRRPADPRRRGLPAQRHGRRRGGPLPPPRRRPGPGLHRAAPRRVPGLPPVRASLRARAGRRTPTTCSASRIAPSKQLLALAARGGPAAGDVRAARRAARRLQLRAPRGGAGPAEQHEDGRDRLRRPRQREERHRAVAAGRAVPPGPRRAPRHRLSLVHPDPAQGRRASGSSSAEDVHSTSTRSWPPSRTTSTR